MKKKYFSVFMVVCMLVAAPGVLNCRCVDADCGAASQAIRAHTPQCHAGAAQKQGEDPVRKECCGKCRIEKAAVLSGELSPSGDVRPRNTFAEIEAFVDFHPKIRHLSFSQERFSESPPGFFEKNVLNTTFSFRAPPQAYPL